MSEDIITSAQNDRIKHLVRLWQKSSVRCKEGLFVVEGLRELKHCIANRFDIHAVYYCPELLIPDQDIESLIREKPSFALSKKVYEKVAYRGTTEGILAEVKGKTLHLRNLKLNTEPFIIVLEAVEKPGNLGAVLRTADACGADAVIMCDVKSDLYNPNLIRSSIGAVFTVPCVSCSTTECITFLKERKIKIISAQLQNSQPYYDIDMRPPVALVMGSEATGLTSLWRKSADYRIHIPMLGQLDSLNVSTSTAILAYEVIRQKK